MRTICLMCFLCFPVMINAGDIVSDFNADRWIVRTTARLDIDQGGDNRSLVINNRSDTLGIIKFNTDTRGAPFTYSADIATQNPAYLWLGLSFCMKSNLEGYYFTVDTSQTWMLFKYSHEGENLNSEIIYSSPHSFINMNENSLKVSKNGSEITLFANGRTLWSDTSSDFDSGSIGLVIHNNVTASISNIRWTDGAAAPTEVNCFAPDLVEDSLDGWYRGYARVFPSFIDSSIVLQSGDSLRSILMTNGEFDSSSIKATVSFSDGSTGGAYGVTFVDIVRTPDSTYYRNYAFVLNPEGEYYGVVKPDSLRFDWSQTGYTSILGGKAENTIVVSRDNDTYHFIVNGDSIVDANVEQDFDIDAAGIIAIPDTTAPRYVVMNCSFFAVSPGDNFECPVHFPGGTRLDIVRAVSDGDKFGMVFDPLGRKIHRFAGRHVDIIKSLPAGTFIVVPDETTTVAPGRIKILAR
ncbi:MAG: hypothetical protein GF350_02940 [Chitinivibrionales bacterium]|nr:hypothetical protein [Chitinivibrionales bacterium]